MNRTKARIVFYLTIAMIIVAGGVLVSSALAQTQPPVVDLSVAMDKAEQQVGWHVRQWGHKYHAHGRGPKHHEPWAMMWRINGCAQTSDGGAQCSWQSKVNGRDGVLRCHGLVFVNPDGGKGKFESVCVI
jgi:hypothetical protein